MPTAEGVNSGPSNHKYEADEGQKTANNSNVPDDPLLDEGIGDEMSDTDRLIIGPSHPGNYITLHLYLIINIS